MYQFNGSPKTYVAGLATIMLMPSAICGLPVLASSISGITPESMQGGGNQYNIDPTFVNGDTGFRHYADFTLDKGDVANLIYKNNQDKFVNLVDNRININGILNTMRDNNFYNGHAIFVSPMGMTIGASGVLNVGSLTAIAPNPIEYLKYTGFSYGKAAAEGLLNEADKVNVLNNAANSLGLDLSNITIPGLQDDVSLKLLKESNSIADIDVKGKIIARGDVELLAKHVKVEGTKDNPAGIMAGVPTEHDIKLATLEQANNLFKNLVTNNIQNGIGFERDAKGNVIIKAQSTQVAQVSTPEEKLIIDGIEYGLDQFFKLTSDNEYVLMTDEELKNLSQQTGVDFPSLESIKTALQSAIELASPSDASDPNSINNKNAATVNINNAVLGGKNIDVNAVSKVTYTTQKGTPLFDRLVNTVVDEVGGTSAFLDKFTSGGTFNDFEGARAKASIEIGDNTKLVAKEDVEIKSLATAETNMKIKSWFPPNIDTTSEGFYYLGTQTISEAIVKDGAEITAGNNIDVIAAARNSLNAKITNPTSYLDSLGASIASAPSVQVSILKTVIDADTKADVQKGSILNAGNNVNVNSVSIVNDQTVLSSIANVTAVNGSNAGSSGIAISLSFKDTNVDTEAILDGIVNAYNNVDVTAQNVHVGFSSGKTEVSEISTLSKAGVSNKLISKISGLISSKFEKLGAGLDVIQSTASKLPSVSVALVENNTDVNATAKIGKNANITAGHDVKVNANTIDMTVNNASADVSFEKDWDNPNSTTSKPPSPGVAVIVNNQNNDTQAIIEDGDSTARAIVKAGNKVSVNATTEQPMNDTTFQLALNVVQTYQDGKDLFSEEKDNLSTILSFVDNPDTLLTDESDWDVRVFLQQLTNPIDEEAKNISDVIFGVKNANPTMLGLQGFFNNWASSTSKNPEGVGISASVVVTDAINNTLARIGNNAIVTAKTVDINAANSVVQFNAAGNVSKIWEVITGGTKGSSGIGGTVLYEKVESNAKAQIGDGAVINAEEDVSVASANDQDFLTVVFTGGKATGDGGVSINGSVIVQEITGSTESSVGASIIDAKNLSVNAGLAKIEKVKDSLDQLQENPFEDLDKDRFEVGLEEDMKTAEIKRFTDTDINLGVDEKLFPSNDITEISTLVGDAKIGLMESSSIKDSISNLMLTGALSVQKAETPEGGGGSSGAAIGASVNVSEFNRDVQALIKDGANITLSKDLNVIADSKTQSLDIALAGAFAGGMSVAEPGVFDKVKQKIKNTAMTKVSGILNNAKNDIGLADIAGATSNKLDDKGNPIIVQDGVEYKTDLNGQYYDPKTGTVLTDKNGNKVTSGSLGSTSANPQLSNLDTSSAASAANNVSAALAGSINAQINESTVKAEIGKANIKIGGDINVKANQKTGGLNIAAGVAKASTVGAGAAVNFIQNTNETVANIEGANIEFSGQYNELNVIAEENNDNIEAAIGVGVTTDDPTSVHVGVAAGGSFNTDVLKNKVTAQIKDSTITNVDGNNSISILVDAENHTTSYKGAGGLAVSASTFGSTSVGAGMAGNLNLLTKETNAIVDNSDITYAKTVDVYANRDKTQKTEELFSVGIGGAVVASSKGAYAFAGAMGTDIIDNTVKAEIINQSNISSAGNINVLANNYISTSNIAGALSFSVGAPDGLAVGVGAIVNVLNTDTTSRIKDSTITNAVDINVNSNNKEDLGFLAVNFGLSTNGILAAGVNGIVNVSNGSIISELIDSNIRTAKTLNITTSYDADIEGITAVGAVSGQGMSFGANIVSNTFVNDNKAKVKGSDVTLTDALTVSADSNESVDSYPVAVSISGSGAVAAAANIGVNVISNSTQAYIDGSDNNAKSTLDVNGINVTAQDNSHLRSRGGTIAINGGSTSVAGSILTDVYVKDVKSYIDNVLVKNAGDINVSASTENISGTKDPMSITASSLVSEIQNKEKTEKDNDDLVSGIKSFNLHEWDMTYDISGSSSAAVAGSVIVRTVVNDVDSYIGSNTEIQKAGDISVLSNNTTNSAAIIGNVSASGTAAIGATIFANVNNASVNAGIKDGAIIGSSGSPIGAITLAADSVQDYHILNFVVGASGSASVNGSATTNVVVNETNAYIEKGANINAESVALSSDDTMDVQALNLAVAASGGAAVGAIAHVNIFDNDVNSIIGKNDDSSTDKVGNINASGDITIDASAAQDYQANIAMVSASGAAAVGAIIVSNTMATSVNAGIEEITVNSQNTTINATNGYNENNKSHTVGVKELLKGEDDISVETDDLTSDSKYIPLVMALNIAGSGGGAVSGSIINNNVITSVNSYVKNADVTTTDTYGLKLASSSTMTTYDAVMGVAGAGGGAANVVGVVNVYSGDTTAEIDNSTIIGNTSLNADDTFNLNTIIFSAAGASAVAVNAVTNTNVLVNDVTAAIKNSDIRTAQTVDVITNNSIDVTDIIVAGAVSGTGASVNVIPINNIFIGTTKSYIEDSLINGATTTVDANNNIDTLSGVVGVTGSGIGAGVGGYAITDVFENDLVSYIDGTTITNAKSTSVSTQSDLDMTGLVVSAGITGGGANVLLNAITNVVDNNLNSYINNSSITGGDVKVAAVQNAVIDSNTAGVSAAGIGGAGAINSIINIIENDAKAYINNTETTDVSGITVSTATTNNFTNLNVGVTGTGLGGAVAVNALVNVLENTGEAYIDTDSKTMNVSGDVSVSSTDSLTLDNTMGALSISGGGAASANVNVNVINNAVKAQILGNEDGLLSTSGNVGVNASSTLAMNTGLEAISLGYGAVAGNVIVNSIGGKYAQSDNSLNDAGIDDSISDLNGNYKEIYGSEDSANKGEKVASYTDKDGNTKTLENRLSLTGSTGTKEGTVANISANVEAGEDVNVIASNIVKGLGDSDTLKLSNLKVGVGAVAAGVGVLVTDMKYNTKASIKDDGSKVANVSAGQDVNVEADSQIKAKIETDAYSVAGLSVSGNVGYLKNVSKTAAIIDSATVDADGNVIISAEALDNINTDIESTVISLANVGLSISLAETQNTVDARIQGSNVDIDAGTLNVKATNTSTLRSAINTTGVGLADVGVAVNRTKSSAITNALITASGTVDVDDMNIIAQTGGIDAKTSIDSFSVSGLKASISDQESSVYSNFNAGLDNKEGLEVTNNGDTTILAGVEKTDNYLNPKQGSVSAQVQADSFSVALADLGMTRLKANVSAESNAKSVAKKHKAGSMDIASMLKRSATIDSDAQSGTIISLNDTELSSYVGGSNSITLDGDNEIKSTINLTMKDTADTYTEMLSGKVSFVDANNSEMTSVIETETDVNINGILAMDKLNIETEVEKTAELTSKAKSYGALVIDKMKAVTKADGDSDINFTAQVINTDYRNAIKIDSKAKNYVDVTQGTKGGAVAAFRKGKTYSTLDATNEVNFDGAKLDSSGNLYVDVNNENRFSIENESSNAAVLVGTGNEFVGAINSGSAINVEDSDLSAKSVKLSTNSFFGNIDDKQVKYDIDASGFSASDTTNVTNAVSQSSEISLTNSLVKATENLTVSIADNSEFSQRIDSDGAGFVADINASSTVKVTNSNTLSIDSDSMLYSANQLEIDLDSSNELESIVKLDVGHFGGRDANGDSVVNLTVNNNIENDGIIQSGETALVNFMQNSENEINQNTDIRVEAAVATAEAGGGITYTTNNKLVVSDGAKIESGKDVIANYGNGNNELTSYNYEKKTSRLLFGIPITDTDSSKKVTTVMANSLELDGEIIAGAKNQKYMRINQDGTVDESTLQGFYRDEYTVQDVSYTNGAEETAKTILTLQEEINELNKQKDKLNALEDDYTSQIAAIEAEIDALNKELNKINSLVDSADVSSYEDVKGTIITDIATEFANDYVSENENISVESMTNLATSILLFYETYLLTTEDAQPLTFEQYLERQGDMTAADIDKFVAAYDKCYKNLVELDSGLVKYKNVYIEETVSVAKITTSAEIATKEATITAYENSIKNLSPQREAIDDNIAELNNQIAYLEQNPMPDTSIEKAAIQFEDLILEASKIELNGINNTNITGGGEFKTYDSSLVIDNYSNRDLIFNKIDLSNSKSGLYILKDSYNDFMNTGKPVNTRYGNKISSVSVSNTNNDVHYVSIESPYGNNTVSINTYFDHNNPTISLADAIQSSINFNNTVKTAGSFNVLNENGDINFINSLSTETKTIVASQGNINYNAPATTLTISANDNMIAGKNVNINAKETVIDGHVQAGLGDRNVTITDEMLANLIVDPTTGEKNMVDLGLTNKSAYLNDTNNIKVLYKDGKILVFNTFVDGSGNVDIAGTVSGKGSVAYSNGYNNINIVNNTNKELVVNTIESKELSGKFANIGTITDITNLAHESAISLIDSTGAVTVVGAIKNETSSLDITSDTGVLVNEKRDIDGTLISTVEAVGNLNITNNGAEGITFAENAQVKVSGSSSKVNINNTNGDITVSENAMISNHSNNEEDNFNINNSSNGLVKIFGEIRNIFGNMFIKNTGAESGVVIAESGVVRGAIGNVNIQNDGSKGVVVDGLVTNGNDINITNNGKGTLAVGETGSITINEGSINLNNTADGGVTLAGKVYNNIGDTNITNDNTNGGIKFETTSTTTNNDGNITISNNGSQGIVVEGIVESVKSNIEIENKDSDIVIGEYDSDNDNYIKTGNNVVINQINGDILNGIQDGGSVGNNQNHDLGTPDKAYKTLIATANDLTIAVNGGNVGSDTHALTGKESGFSINAETRDYTESININTKGVVKITGTDNELVNIRAKDSDLNLDNITSDGNVMLTAADWKQADVRPTPTDEEYFKGYSINNSAEDKTQANITGRNISIISSDNIGASDNKITYNQLENGSVSALAENNLYITSVGENTNTWQLIAKRGDMDIDFSGNAVIREITAGKHLRIISKGSNLTIYDLGKASNLPLDADILYPHDGLSIAGNDVIPETVEIKVLNVNEDTKSDDGSTLNVYNAYLSGNDEPIADVTLRADNIIAHAYDAPDSVVGTKARPDGFDAQDGRLYSNDYTDPSSPQDKKATGFNTVGDGDKLVFDVQGVSPDDVVAAGASADSREYKPQDPVKTIPAFSNPNAFDDTVYKANDVTLSINSSNDNSPSENRGAEFSNLYVDNAYIDTKDLELSFVDAFITDYAEFLNGNRDGDFGGRYVSDDYRWRAIVDNDFKRNITNTYGIPVTSQLYTALTGSFELDMGNTISKTTKAPVVLYNPYNEINTHSTENSFYRLTYKDDKIQNKTTEPSFRDVEKETSSKTKREHIRFYVVQNDKLDTDYVNVSDKKKYKGDSRIIAIEDISRGGVLVVHDGSLKLREKLTINLDYNGITASPEVEVVRLDSSNRAGLKFVNLDKATASKILYMNMSMEAEERNNVQISHK